MGYKLTLTNLQNVVPGNKAVLKCPAGKGAPTYDQIRFELGGGLLPAKILSIVGKANGRVFMDEGPGDFINKLDAYRGLFTENAYVVADFTEPKARNGAAEQLVASVPGSLLQDLSFEIKLDATAAAGSTLKAIAVYRPPTTNPWIRKVLNTSQAFAAAGTDGAPQIIYLPTGGAGGKIKRIRIVENTTAGGITAAQIRIANNVVHECTRVDEESDQKRNGLTPQAGIFMLDFVKDGNLAGMLDTGAAPVTELRLVGAINSYTVYYELIDPIGRL